jgi:ribosomal-protein-alanine N-acetyltransferase
LSERLSFVEASIDDASNIYDIEIRVHQKPWTYVMLQQSLEGEHLCWKLLEGNQLVGYMIVMQVMEQFELLNIAVADSHQTKGLGNYLIKALKNQADKKSVKTIFLEVRESNKPAVSLYQKHGFLQVGKRKNYYVDDNRKEDALIMQLPV